MIIDISDVGSIISGLGTFAVVIFFLIMILSTAIKIVPEYRRIVLFRLGRLVGSRGPGIVFTVPFLDKAVTVDLRILTLDVPVQEVITKDNVAIKVNAVVYFRVLEPAKSVVEVENYVVATSQLAQTTLRSVVGSVELDEVLSSREKINQELQKIIDERTDPWGIKVSAVEVKELELPEGMKRAMARQAEAERERRAKIIAAEGELQAAEKLSEAARKMEASPITLQLRYLQTIREISGERNTTTFFPIPVDLIQPFIDRMTSKKTEA
ncbi:MAG: slipin family protein [Synergistaceae bacterium]|nr:slipin family protein [Synergistaceae bacterium]MBQ6737061.1 slipin family protein [Synergistaceae bacterium]MBQ7069137.1 slipin family protein [Synergistaceae bacterium]MBR0079375.1 slipin family protein [Synergistaceae bacterium]MBR0234456.1 slipin family protein [Synergistaceae bacterium]